MKESSDDSEAPSWMQLAAAEPTWPRQMTAAAIAQRRSCRAPRAALADSEQLDDTLASRAPGVDNRPAVQSAQKREPQIRP
jgi:hypothetical protein